VIKRILAVWHARNLEFVRDRGTMIFTLIMPVTLIVGMSFVFGGPERPLFKVGVLTPPALVSTATTTGTFAASARPAPAPSGDPPAIDRKSHPFLAEHYVDFVSITGLDDGLRKITHQQIDLLVNLKAQPAPLYWVNTDSPKGYIVEKLLLSSTPGAKRQPVTGAAIRYVDWLFPGILGMNLMFSCLFGVGYVVLRYRKNGFLKRLHATPLTAFEFLSAQVLSRLVLTLLVTSILYIGVGAIIHFHTVGSLTLLFIVLVTASLSMIALGLTIASRFASEELVGGLLNLLTWPMMLLSGIWFSLEGSPKWIQWVADVFPLTHLLQAARGIMIDGAGLSEIAPHLAYLAITAIVFLFFGAWSFRWRIE
jgi:ABC-type multidrug transport system permease subunit